MPFIGRWSRDALIQATLDDCVDQIDRWSGPLPSIPDAIFAFISVQQGQRALVVLCETTEADIPAPAGVQTARCVSRATIMRDPGLMSARAIWAMRTLAVPPAFAIQTMHKLRGAPRGLPLIDLQDEGGTGPIQWPNFVMAMACTGLVTLSWRGILSDLTMVKLRFRTKNQSN